jgi:WD40 repeat protein
MRSSAIKSMFLLSSAIALAQSGGTFTATGNMITARTGHTATLLLSGKVLIAGGVTTSLVITPNSVYGQQTVLASAEIYDPSTGMFTATGSMPTARTSHSATLLPDGRVLIAGGSGDLSAEIYDPSSGTFTAAGKLVATPYSGLQSATLLRDGRVFVAGQPTAQIYDPATGMFAAIAPYVNPAPDYMDCTVLLADGRVLLTGGDDIGPPGSPAAEGWSELYDPLTNSFAATGGANLPCANPLLPAVPGWAFQPGGGGVCWFVDVNTVTLLPNGKALIAGSADSDFGEYNVPADAEVYDPSTGIFTSIGKTIAPHESSTATLLPDGTVLIAGSWLGDGNDNPAVELYDPASSKFVFAGNMVSGRSGQTATLLPDGTVLIAGGGTSTAEIYHPAVLVPSPVLYSLPGGMQGAIWHNTTGELVSPSSPAVAGEVLAMYTNNLIEAV